MAASLSSHKPSMQDGHHMLGISGEAGMNSLAIICSELQNMDTLVLVDQQKQVHQLCTDTRCRQGDLPGAMDDRYGYRKREREFWESVQPTRLDEDGA